MASSSPENELLTLTDIREVVFDRPHAVQRWCDVEFEAATINPWAPTAVEDEKLPLLIYMCGMDNNGEIDENDIKMLSKKAPTPFLYLSPHRVGLNWWFLDDGQPNGWVEGELDTRKVAEIITFIQALSLHPRVEEIHTLGFSAGAYALTEIFAGSGNLPVKSITVGGVHGHGSSAGNTVEITKKLKKKYQDLWPRDEIEARLREKWRATWEAYILRLQGSSCRVEKINAVHNEEDNLSDFQEAQELLDAIDFSRSSMRADYVMRKLLKRKASRKTSAHKYYDDALELALEELPKKRARPETQQQQPEAGRRPRRGTAALQANSYYGQPPKSRWKPVAGASASGSNAAWQDATSKRRWSEKDTAT